MDPKKPDLMIHLASAVTQFRNVERQKSELFAAANKYRASLVDLVRNALKQRGKADGQIAVETGDGEAVLLEWVSEPSDQDGGRLVISVIEAVVR